jgi:hypothetical protein
MTPEEMRDVLLEEARWWANKPEHAESAARWVMYFEQLPEDDPMLVLLAGEDQNAKAFRASHRHRFTVWNMTCNILQKLSWRWTAPPT